MRPIYVFLFMLACLGALALMCLVMPQDMHSPDLAQVFEVPEEEFNIEEPDTMPGVVEHFETWLAKIEDLNLRERLNSIDLLGKLEGIDLLAKLDSIDLLAKWDSITILQKPEIPDSIVTLAKQEEPEMQAEDIVVEVKAEPVVMDSPEVVAVQETPKVAQPQPQPQPQPIPEVFDTTDTRKYLTKFYASLKQASSQAIRVVHYGDSQIEEDRLTTQVRRAFQQKYGGGGVGIIPLHQTIPTRTIWQSIVMNGRYQQINQGPKRYLVYGPKSMRRSNSVYGVMGQVARMDNNLVAGSEDIEMQINGTGKSKNVESYFNRIRVVKSGDISVTIERATDRQGDVFIVPDSTTSATIHFQGKGDVFGISLEKDHGVMVDNIPMRGCSGAVFTGIAANELQHYYSATNTRLIILQYGGNIMPFTTTKKQVAQYIIQMQTQIQYLKYLAPESSIVFVGPSDMCERRDGQLQTYQMIPVMDRALQQMAIEEEIGYFSLYQHMGGKGSMIKWKEQGLAGGDYVHFTRKGADKAGVMLAEWLMKK